MPRAMVTEGVSGSFPGLGIPVVKVRGSEPFLG